MNMVNKSLCRAASCISTTTENKPCNFFLPVHVIIKLKDKDLKTNSNPKFNWKMEREANKIAL